VPLFLFLLGIFTQTAPRAAAANARGAGLEDKGEFFSERAKTEASKLISQTASKFHKDLRIETFAEIPESERAGTNLKDKAAVNAMFEKWARREAGDKDVNGVFVLMVKKPSHLHVVVDKGTQLKTFTSTDRDALVALMITNLKQKKFDEALLEGTRFVTSQFSRHVAPRAQSTHNEDYSLFPTKTSGFGWLPSLLIFAGIVWLVLRLIGGLFSAFTGPSYPMGGAPGGGGFFRSLLGGMFGAAAGMWLYDQFLGHSSGSTAWGADTGAAHPDASSDDTPPSLEESDYSGSGGDFDSDSDSSGDFGSDFDSGGGDFGDFSD
jgi:uncharacterized protein